MPKRKTTSSAGGSWKCPKCGRTFAKRNQSHSCGVVPLARHFRGRPARLRKLYDELVSRAKSGVGPFRIDPVECCIHFVSTYTFAGVYVMKDRLRISFSSTKKIGSPRVRRHLQVSPHRHMQEVEIADFRDIDAQLMSWLRAGYALGMKRPKA